MTKLRYQLSNIHCMNCVKTINEYLEKAEAVDEHELLFERSQVSLTLDENKLSRSELSREFEALGFPVLQVKEL